jgi:hypothetical protein
VIRTLRTLDAGGGIGSVAAKFVSIFRTKRPSSLQGLFRGELQMVDRKCLRATSPVERVRWR